MEDLFKTALDLEGKVIEMKGHCNIISIEVNTAMQAHLNSEKRSDRFLAERYLELVEDLANYGIIKKEW